MFKDDNTVVHFRKPLSKYLSPGASFSLCQQVCFSAFQNGRA
jgi:hypothetical protein